MNKKRFRDIDNCKSVPCCESLTPQEELKYRTDDVKRYKCSLKKHLKIRDSLVDISSDYTYPRNEVYLLIGANTIAIDAAKTDLCMAKEKLKQLGKVKK